MHTVLSGSLLLQLVGFGRGHAGPPACGTGGCLGRATWARSLARIFAIAFGGLQSGLGECGGAAWAQLMVVLDVWAGAHGLVCIFAIAFAGLQVDPAGRGGGVPVR